MREKRKKYYAAFRREAVRLASEPGMTGKAVERDLGLHEGGISHWKPELEKDPAHAFPGKGRMKPLEEENRLFDIPHAEKELYEYIEQYYNGQRLHVTLGYLSPVQYEDLNHIKCASPGVYFFRAISHNLGPRKRDVHVPGLVQVSSIPALEIPMLIFRRSLIPDLC